MDLWCKRSHITRHNVYVLLSEILTGVIQSYAARQVIWYDTPERSDLSCQINISLAPSSVFWSPWMANSRRLTLKDINKSSVVSVQCPFTKPCQPAKRKTTTSVSITESLWLIMQKYIVWNKTLIQHYL